MNRVCLGLGTNLGDREANLTKALILIEEQIGRIIARSPWYSFPAIGFISENDFLNGAIEVETSLAPFDILDRTQAIERQMGKSLRTNREEPLSDRIIDIDLLLFGDLIVDSERLILPHPQLHKRIFVLRPLCDIVPNIIHPTIRRTIAELYDALNVSH